MPKTLQILLVMSVLWTPLTAWAADSAEETRALPADSAVEQAEPTPVEAASVAPVASPEQNFVELVTIDFLEDRAPLNMTSVEQVSWGRVCEDTCHPCFADYQCPFNQRCRSSCH